MADSTKVVEVLPFNTQVMPPDRHPAAVYLARLAPGSRRTMREALDIIAKLSSSGAANATTLPWQALRYQHTAAIRSALAESYSPATVNKALSALKGVLREAWRLGFLTAEDRERACDLPSVRGTSLPRGRMLASGELHGLFGVCAADPSPAGARDASLLALLFGAGLRRSEAVALDLADYEAASGELTVRRGKGAKARTAWATNGASKALAAWLEVRGSAPGPLLCPITKGGNVVVRRLTAQAVYLVLQKRAVQAGVEACSPHDLRRSFVSELLDRGADVSAVQRLAGHANVATTLRYDRRPEAAKRKAAELLHVPYAPRPRRPL